jgi:hypothetical protein
MKLKEYLGLTTSLTENEDILRSQSGRTYSKSINLLQDYANKMIIITDKNRQFAKALEKLEGDTKHLESINKKIKELAGELADLQMSTEIPLQED